jgi:UDP-N-acetyl-D-mannosaminuronate dehydrogenase
MSITSTAKPIIESGAANTAGVGIIGLAFADDYSDFRKVSTADIAKTGSTAE